MPTRRPIARRIAGICAFAAAFMAGSVFAQAPGYPTKPIRMIMAVGGGGELVARMAAQRLAENLGQPVPVEIQAGAAGAVGAQMVAQAPPDGYTLLYAGSSSQIMRVYLAKNTPYDPVRDFTPISRGSGAVLAVLANASLPATSMKEFIDYAKKHPGKISYASSGIGTNHHLSAELLKQVTGIDIVHVPYKSGAQVLTGLITDQVPIAFGIVATAVPYVKAGKVRVLAINGTERYEGMPEVPTIGEQVPGYVPPPGWSGFFGPAGLPAPIVGRLNKIIVSALTDTAFRAKAEAAGLILSPSTPEEFAAEVKRDLESVGRIVKAAGLKPE